MVQLKKMADAVQIVKKEAFKNRKLEMTYFKNKEDRVQLLPLRFVP